MQQKKLGIGRKVEEQEKENVAKSRHKEGLKNNNIVNHTR